MSSKRNAKNGLMVSNRIDKVLPFLDNADQPVQWVLVGASAESHRLADLLRSDERAQEMDSGELFRPRREEFRRKYIQFMADLNQHNGSLNWWGLPPSSKDPNTSSLAWDVAAFLLIVDLVREGYRRLLVVSDSPHLAAQVRVWAAEQGVPAVCQVKGSDGWGGWSISSQAGESPLLLLHLRRNGGGWE